MLNKRDLLDSKVCVESGFTTCTFARMSEVSVVMIFCKKPKHLVIGSDQRDLWLLLQAQGEQKTL